MIRIRILVAFFFILFISACATVKPPVATHGVGVYHIVGSGQTLYRIAKAYDVDLNELMRVNNITDPRQLGVGQELLIPNAARSITVAPIREKFEIKEIESIVQVKRSNSSWRYITVHHSATTSGNAEIFDLNHRKRHMGGLAYHFVIGNGTDSCDGEIEVGWRWRKQVKVNRPYDLQICLVGNFNRQEVSDAQFNSLVALIKVLRKQYDISLSNVRRHKDIKDKKTDCPGKNFPFYRLKQELLNK
jgi:LysM repeat protein